MQARDRHLWHLNAEKVVLALVKDKSESTLSHHRCPRVTWCLRWIGKVMDAQMGDMRKEFQAKQTEQDSKIAQLEARMATFDNKLEEFLATRQQDEKKMQALQE
eukprot:1662125-Karenia_brevis.AAC.1